MPSSVRNPAIVVGVDSSENALLALDWAVDEAARRDCPIRLVHAYRPSGPGHDLGRQAVMVEMYAEGQNVFASAREHMAGRREAGRVVGTALHEGSPGTVLADLTAGAPMCVVGRRGRVRLTSFVLGSTALDLASRSDVPLVVVPPEWRQEAVDRKPVLVGVDLPLRRPDGLAFAFAAAERSAVPLVALCAWDLGLSRLDAMRTAEMRTAGMRTGGMRTPGTCTEVGQILADLLAPWHAGSPVRGADRGRRGLHTGGGSREVLGRGQSARPRWRFRVRSTTTTHQGAGPIGPAGVGLPGGTRARSDTPHVDGRTRASARDWPRPWRSQPCAAGYDTRRLTRPRSRATTGGASAVPLASTNSTRPRWRTTRVTISSMRSGTVLAWYPQVHAGPSTTRSPQLSHTYPGSRSEPPTTNRSVRHRLTASAQGARPLTAIPPASRSARSAPSWRSRSVRR